jgi:hypothetical protein
MAKRSAFSDMARKSKRPTSRRPARTASRRRGPSPARRPAAKTRDPLDDLIIAAARALSLPAERPWLPAIRTNLRVTLQFAAVVAEFKLPDDAEPAPVFRA